MPVNRLVRTIHFPPDPSPGTLHASDPISGIWAEIGEASAVHLYGLTALRKVNLIATLTTDAGIVALKRALPDCDVAR